MPRRSRKVPAVPVRGGWDVLPHNMGAIPSAGAVEPLAELVKSSSGTTPLTPPGIIDKIDSIIPEEASIQPTTRQLRPRNRPALPRLAAAAAPQPPPPPPPPSPPHNSTLDTQIPDVQAKDQTPKRKRQRTANPADDHGEFNADSPSPKLKKARKGRKTKDNPYGLTPGETPFPEWQAPSVEQCEEVYQLLAKMHDDVRAQAPEVIPAPSLEVAGCGEVPSVLDALIRTVLSGATTFENADKMIKGLTKKFGVLTEGIGEGSIDWNNVRTSPIEDLVGAIRCGGLGNAKAKSIKGILDMVYQENIERREAYLREKQTGEQADVFAAADKTKGQKDLEILKTDKNILSLDHIHGLPADEAMRQFTKYPGVGVKTSACVILFCLQRPCFAVDTHVNKFSKWLGWAPEKATEDDVFSHLEVRCPDHLKYGLHQLFIRHGQTCEKCRRSTAEGTDSWRKLEECPLESLLNRYDKRQSKAKPKPPKKAKGEKPEAEPDVKKEEQEDGADTTGAKNGPAEDGMEAGDQVEEGSEAKEDDDIKKEGEA